MKIESSQEKNEFQNYNNNINNNKIPEEENENDHEKSNGNLLIENYTGNPLMNNIDRQIFEYLNKMKEIKKNENTCDNSLDNLIIKNQKNMIAENSLNNNNNYNTNNRKSNLRNNDVLTNSNLQAKGKNTIKLSINENNEIIEEEEI